MAYILTRKNPIVTETKTGSILTFNSALPVVADDVSSLITGYQEGSGTPSLDNVRNLVSFDVCNVSRTGINIWDEVWEVGGITWGTGINDSSTDKIRSKNYIPVCPNTSYFINVPRSGGPYLQTNVFFYNKDKSFISSLFVNVNQSQRTITTPANCYYMRFYPYGAYGTTYNSDISINYPSTDTSYHSGKANKYYTLSFGQSIYEGTIDFTTGVLTANRILVTLTGDSSESYALSASNRRINYSISDILLNSGVDDTVDGYLCNRFEQITPNQSYRTNMGFAVNTTNSVIFFNDGSGEMTVEGWRTWLASNNIQLVVMLATPIEIQLTPTEISLLQGTNNLWSSTGNLTVQFKNVK